MERGSEEREREGRRKGVRVRVWRLFVSLSESAGEWSGRGAVRGEAEFPES